MRETTRQDYIRELDELTESALKMGELSRRAVSRAVKAFMEGDLASAERVMQEDDVIDDMLVEVEDRCILLIAKQQPIAHDLRVIATVFKLSTDIERIGDHAYDIAKTTSDVRVALPEERLSCVRALSDCVIRMVTLALEAYRQGDVILAGKVRHMDKEMGECFRRAYLSLNAYVSEEAARQREITELLFIARFLERIGDHAVNIAEWVVYLETARRM